MRSFTEEQFRDAVEARKVAAHDDLTPQAAVLLEATDILEQKFRIFSALNDGPRAAFVAAMFYGMLLAFEIDDAMCEPGDYYCLEHREKNCECTCEGASQVGKSSEVLNPAGPRYF